MSLFGKKSPQASLSVPAKATYIAEGLVVTGDITGEGELNLDGTLRGNISCKRLVVGATGALHGEVTVDALIVDGSIYGSVKAKTVLLGATARVIGDVDHEVLEVHSGAEIEGRYSQADFAVDSRKAKGLKFGAMQKESLPVAPQGARPLAPQAATTKSVAKSEGDAAASKADGASASAERPSTH